MATKFKISDNYVGRAKSAKVQKYQQRNLTSNAREKMQVSIREKAKAEQKMPIIFPLGLTFTVLSLILAIYLNSK